MEGRGTQTTGLVRAGEFIAQRWKELGLKVDSFDGQPFQNFSIPGPLRITEPTNNTLSWIGTMESQSRLSWERTSLLSRLGPMVPSTVISYSWDTVSLPKVKCSTTTTRGSTSKERLSSWYAKNLSNRIQRVVCGDRPFGLFVLLVQVSQCRSERCCGHHRRE